MSERVVRPFEKTQIIPNAVTVYTGKTVFEGWEDLQMTRELNSLASDFQFQMTDKWKPEKKSFQLAPGDPIHIHVAKQPFTTGWIDKLKPSFSTGKRSIAVSGRSKTADLVDCSADGTQFSNLTLKDLAIKQCLPFNISVIFKGDPGLPFPDIKVEHSETVFALLDRHARQRKILMYPDYNGNLVFSPQAERKATTSLVEGVNIKSGSSSFDNSNRFSEYRVKGQNLAFLGNAANSITAQGVAKDLGVTRFRPMNIMSEQSIDSGKSGDRAEYEAHLRAAKAMDVEVEVVGWFQEDGTPWEINQLVKVDIGSLGVRRQMLIKKVTFNKNNSGTTCNISLTRNDAFLFGVKELKKENPLGWEKFVEKPK